MSEFLRPTIPRHEVLVGGPTTLARLTHKAEDAGDDVLLLEIMDGCGRREQARPGFYEIFRSEYVRLHRPEFRSQA